MRIVALQPSISIVLDQLGAASSIVACTRYCVEAVPELRARAIPVIADSWTATTEQILAQQPDLVIASVPYRLETLAAILKTGCAVLTLAPHTLADVESDIRLLGAVVDRSTAAARLIAKMRSEISVITARAAELSSQTGLHPLVYCEEWGKPAIHSQPWVAELVQAAGARFLGTPGAHADLDAIAAADPDVLVFAWCGAGDRVPLERVIEKRGWSGLRAVRERNCFCIQDEFLNTPAPTLFCGLRQLAVAIHGCHFGGCGFGETESPRRISAKLS
ncbi:MAG: ABC transporter substrate-binding protein [Acidobacteriaceae bacterium]